MNMSAGLGIFVEMGWAWHRHMPAELASEDSKTLITLLDYVGTNGGASQKEIAQYLSISKSKLSKLKVKLLSARFVSVKRHPENARVLMMYTTVEGAKAVLEVKKELNRVFTIEARRNGLRKSPTW